MEQLKVIMPHVAQTVFALTVFVPAIVLTFSALVIVKPVYLPLLLFEVAII